MFSIQFKVVAVLILALGLISIALMRRVSEESERQLQGIQQTQRQAMEKQLNEAVQVERERLLQNAFKLVAESTLSSIDTLEELRTWARNTQDAWSSLVFIPADTRVPETLSATSDRLFRSISESEHARIEDALNTGTITSNEGVLYCAWPLAAQTRESRQGVLRCETPAQPPARVAFAPPRQDFSLLQFSLQLTLGIGGVLLVVVVIGTLHFFVVKPLSRLVHASSRVAKGDLTESVDGENARDELGRLTGTFNQMQREIRGYRDDMERRIGEARAEIKNQERSLVVAQKLAATGTLAAGLAHEINNPLGAMQNAARRLKKQVESERAGEYVELIEEGLDRIGMLMRQILDFSRKRDSQPEVFNVASVLDQSQAFVRHRFQEPFALVVESEESLPELFGTPSAISQVLINLIINARDALPSEGGQVSLRARTRGKDCEIEVSDTGSGIDDETLEHIFDPFYTTKEVGKGTGLGLAIAYTVVKNHDGIISVESKPGEGTAFTISLPIHEPGPEGPARDA